MTEKNQRPLDETTLLTPHADHEKNSKHWRLKFYVRKRGKHHNFRGLSHEETAGK